ncbi:hypothetical protein [Deinococcus sp. JMULE3]|uniref:hypothetical protein n=1 Tax=Deinococcus sp. JMULE3 TaxID=2518341 RepID=UPI0015750C1C|nr:hypothetical protein [Deinococcus sp. JMULE3]NTY00404.1 hypothetical protein [Deinococcus sp. JMULE3]
MTDNRYGDAPLGKSVEEIQQESGNVVNSPATGEARRAEEAPVVPALVTGTGSGVIAAVRPDALIEPGSGADDGRDHQNRDSSEES